MYVCVQLNSLKAHVFLQYPCFPLSLILISQKSNSMNEIFALNLFYLGFFVMRQLFSVSFLLKQIQSKKALWHYRIRNPIIIIQYQFYLWQIHIFQLHYAGLSWPVYCSRCFTNTGEAERGLHRFTSSPLASITNTSSQSTEALIPIGEPLKYAGLTFYQVLNWRWPQVGKLFQEK